VLLFSKILVLLKSVIDTVDYHAGVEITSELEFDVMEVIEHFERVLESYKRRRESR